MSGASILHVKPHYNLGKILQTEDGLSVTIMTFIVFRPAVLLTVVDTNEHHVPNTIA